MVQVSTFQPIFKLISNFFNFITFMGAVLTAPLTVCKAVSQWQHVKVQEREFCSTLSSLREIKTVRSTIKNQFILLMLLDFGLLFFQCGSFCVCVVVVVVGSFFRFLKHFMGNRFQAVYFLWKDLSLRCCRVPEITLVLVAGSFRH